MLLKVIVLAILVIVTYIANASSSGSSQSGSSNSGSSNSSSSQSGSSKSGATSTSTSGSSKSGSSNSSSTQSGSTSGSSGSSKSGSSASSKSDTSKPVVARPADVVKPTSVSHHSLSKPTPVSHHSHANKHPAGRHPTHLSGELRLRRPIYKFAIEFFGNVTIFNEKQTFVVSPLATLSQLALLTTVSNGQTKKALNTALHLGHSNPAIITEFHGLLESLQNVEAIYIGSTFYIRKGYTVQPKFITEAAKFYTEVHLNNFDPHGAIHINQKAANETHGIIKSVISADVFTPYTTFLLVNAIYFNAGWMFPFSASETKTATFNKGTCASSNAKQVPMMNQVGRFRYGFISSLNAHVLELPFVQSNLTMFILLPKECNGMKDFMSRWHGFDVNHLSGQKYENVKVSLPKFSINFVTDIDNPLSTMGLGNIIANTANFQKILIIPSYSSYQQLYIAEAMHAVAFNVDETGTTGSSSKNSKVTTKKSGSSTKVFNANHSFVFCVTTPQSVVLMGKYEG